MKRAASLFLTLVFAVLLNAAVYAADKAEIDSAVNKAAEYIYNTVKNPLVDSVGGEWAVLGLARSGYDVSESWYEGYYKTVANYVKERRGVLHDKKYTEYSRVILGLTAAGYDPTDIAGYDLTLPLADFDKTVWQGINGPTFALISLDSGNYPNPNRELYITEILRRQLSDGGWNLTAGSNGAEVDVTEKADTDITGMVLQALAKYQYRHDVKSATDRALACLSKLQNADGGFSNNGGEATSESAVQVLVALCELGIDIDDTRFVKNGNSIADNILTYQNADGSFKHTYDGSGNSQMSTEQAFYGLIAAKRASEGMNSLYRMADAVKRGNSIKEETSGNGLPGKHKDVKAVPVMSIGRTFVDVQTHSARKAIEELAARNIINGKTETYFQPNATMTRAEYAAIVTRGLGLEPKKVDIFTDVKEDAWYAGYIGTAYTYGIITGVSPDTFNPNGAVTRREAAVMLTRAAKLCGMDTNLDSLTIRDTLARFGDYVTVPDWAQNGFAFCYKEKIMSDDEFDIKPKENIKRAEIAQMIYNLLEKANLI